MVRPTAEAEVSFSVRTYVEPGKVADCGVSSGCMNQHMDHCPFGYFYPTEFEVFDGLP